MAKVIKMHKPLAKWSGAKRQVLLTMPKDINCALYMVLLEVTQTDNVPLGDATSTARRAAQTLATEIMRRPAMNRLDAGLAASMTVPQSEALTLLAWLLSSPRNTDAAGPLRRLSDALHQLLS